MFHLPQQRQRRRLIGRLAGAFRHGTDSQHFAIAHAGQDVAGDADKHDHVLS